MPNNDKPRLRQAIDDYLIWMSRVQAAKPGTIRNHKSVLGLLVEFTGNIYPENLTITKMDQFLASRPWSVSSRNVRLGIYKQFFAWCRARSYMPRDLEPVQGWRRGRVPEVQRTRIPASEWAALFDACQYPVERITLATGLFLFLRASEQQAIQMKHIDLDAGIIKVHRTKTDEWDDMPISTELDAELRRYLPWYAQQVSIHPDHYLIPPRILGTLARDESNRLLPGTGKIDPTRAHTKPHLIVQRILRAAGYPTGKEGEHTLRRSGARAYFDILITNGYDGALRRVQSMLGHKKSLMTEVYLGLDLDRHTRNLDIIGSAMFPGLITDTATVVSIREVG